MTLQDLIVDLKLNASQFASELSASMRQWEGFSASMAKTGAIMTAAVTLPLVGVAKAAMDMGSQLSQAEIGFATMLGSAEAAGEFLEELKAFAAKTPFEFKDLVPAARRMMALGFATEEVIPMMRALGNAAAGLGGGAPLIDRLTLALGQMRAKGKVSAEEMRQLAEAGIPAWEMLAKAAGKSVGEIMKAAQQGQLSAAQAIPTLIEGMTAKFGGLMENFNKTAMGQFSNVKDKLGFALADIGKSLLPLASLLIEKFAMPAAEALRQVAEWFGKLSESTKLTIIAFAGVVAAIGPLQVALWGLSATWMPMAKGVISFAAAATASFANIAFAVQNNLIGALSLGEKALLGFSVVGVAALAAFAAGFALWQVDAFRKGVQDLWTLIKQFWSESIQPFAAGLAEVGQSFIRAAAEAAASGLKDVLLSLQQALRSDAAHEFGIALGSLSGAMNDLFVAIKPVWEAVSPLLNLMREWTALMVGGQLVAGLEALKLALQTSKAILDALVDAFRFAWTQAMKVATAELQAVTVAVQAFKPILDLASSAVSTFIGWIKQIPGVAAAFKLVSSMFDAMVAKMSSWAASSKQATGQVATTTTTDLDKARTALDQAKTAYDAMLASFNAGKADVNALAASHKAMQDAQVALNTEMSKAGISVDVVRASLLRAQTGYAAAQKAMDGLNKQQKAGTVDSAAYAAGQERVRNAAQAVAEATRLAKDAAKALGVDYGSLIANLGGVASKTLSLAEQEKELKRQIQELERQLKVIIRAYNEGKATIEQVTAATWKLQTAQDRLDPERAAERQQKGGELLLDHLKDIEQGTEAYIKQWARFNQETDKTNQEIADSTIHLSVVFGKALEDMRKEAVKPIAITTTLEQRLPQAIQDAIQNTRELNEAYKTLGYTSAEELRKQADQAEAAEAKVRAAYEVGRTGARDLLLAEKASLEARIAAQEAAGEAITAAERKRLEAVSKELEKYGLKQKTFWATLGQQVSTIINDFARDIAKGLMSTITGTSRREYNRGLDEQAAALTQSLEDRASEWGKYQEDVARRLNQLSADHAASLAKEEQDVAASLSKRVANYEEAAAEAADKLARSRADSAKKLNEDLADIESSLADRRTAYFQYASDIQEKLDQNRRESAARLADELADLQNALDDRRQSYDDYVVDVRTRLSGIYADYAESIDDEKKSTERGIADKKKSYTREQQDILRRIAALRKAGKSENDAEVQDLRVSLARKKEDLDEYIQRANEDLAEFTDDARKRLEKEEKDLQDSLARRTRDWQAYQEENTQKRNEAIQNNLSRLAREEKDLLDSLARRQAEEINYQQRQAIRAEELRTAAAEKLAEEESDLQASLDRKLKELEAYRAEQMARLDEYRAAQSLKLTEETAELEAALAERAAQYEKFQQDVAAQLDALREKHRSILDDIGSFWKNAMVSAGEAVMRFVTEYLVKQLMKTLANLLDDVLPSVAKGLASVFGGGGAGAADLSGYYGGILQGGGGAVGGAGGAAGAAAGAGVSGVVSAVSGVVGAVSGVVGNFQMAGMNKSLDLIEHETRYSQIHLLYILQKLNDHLPKLTDLHSFFWDVGLEIWKEIHDSITGLHLMIGPNFANLLDKMDTLITNTDLGTIPTLGANVLGGARPAIASSIVVQGNVIGNRTFLEDMDRRMASRLRLQRVGL